MRSSKEVLNKVVAKTIRVCIIVVVLIHKENTMQIGPFFSSEGV
jgi:hypothetical protein